MKRHLGIIIVIIKFHMICTIDILIADKIYNINLINI